MIHIVFKQAEDAQIVIDAMNKLICDYDRVTVCDLYDLIDCPSCSEDKNRGWITMHGIKIQYCHGVDHVELVLPDPIPLMKQWTAPKEKEKNSMRSIYFGIKKVIFNGPATIVLWKDGTKTVVKCQEGDVYSKEAGLAMAFCKHILGSRGLSDMLSEWCAPEAETFDSNMKETENGQQ